MDGGKVIKIEGRTRFTLTYKRAFYGNCADDLYILAYCYSNGAGCNTDELKFSHDMLDLYVGQSGVININDVLKLKSLEYTVHFE